MCLVDNDCFWNRNLPPSTTGNIYREKNPLPVLLRIQAILSVNTTLLFIRVSKAAKRGLTLETSAFESLYGGQFTLSTQLIKPNYLVILPTDAAPQFLYTSHQINLTIKWKLSSSL